MIIIRKMPHRPAKGKRRWLWIHFNKLKPLPLSLLDFHNKGYFDRKSFSVQLKGNGKIWWTQLNPGKKDIFAASNFRYYAALLQISYDKVLPPSEAKGS